MTDALSHEASGSGVLDAWVPLGLLDFDPETPLTTIEKQGLTPVRLAWHQGCLREPQPLPAHQPPPSRMVLPRLVDGHVHLDKAYTWQEYPNLNGSYEGALDANLQEHNTRTSASVLQRGERAMERAFHHGLRAMRSHVDSGGSGAEASWEALLTLQQRWRSRIDLQLVALVPLAFWGSAEAEALARRVAASGGCLGGVLTPPWGSALVSDQLEVLLRLADRHNCGVDLHIDEAEHGPAEGMVQLLRALRRVPVSVPITCSHASSLALLPASRLERLAERMAAAQLHVIALPLTNAWLLARSQGTTPLQRPQAPIRQLQRCGVPVAVAGDNVADPWFPGGDFDPLALLAASMPLTQLLPWQRLGLAPFTTAPSAVLQLEWDGVLRDGAPADLISVEGQGWSDLIRCPPQRQVLVKGHWVSSSGARP
ncbi:cytosine deaminase [Synechococcus sp. KORDI-52]|uniref:amidohydrolase family protein n=1 Tax=Synechococcus sp. KORDI-52 TaxID=585425 RepID=UPI0004E0450B|nr:amidohydrolase family protein [Synechococcus sp. KORDI-52]AII49982.1 cytosine deaminase [Synechococcus sp. KORDI-52]